jgi:hypothetical protein
MKSQILVQSLSSRIKNTMYLYRDPYININLNPNIKLNPNKPKLNRKDTHITGKIQSNYVIFT